MFFLFIDNNHYDIHTIYQHAATSRPPADWCNKDPLEKDPSFMKGAFQNDWQKIDKIVASDEFKKQKVSGGLFLYPRQTLSLSQLVKDLILSRNEEINQKGNQLEQPLQVCETGFGAGHSTAFFLSASPKVEIVTFDKFDRDYQMPVMDELKRKFHGRIKHVKGNSCVTVPNFLKKTSGTSESDAFRGCDFIHGSSLCPSDNIDLVQHAKCGTLLTSTAMHSLSDEDVYFGPTAQWRKLRNDECITGITCFSEKPMTLDRSFVFAAKKSKISHKFCFAVVTGACHYSAKTKIRHQVEDKIDDSNLCDDKISTVKEILESLCPDDRIEVPS